MSQDRRLPRRPDANARKRDQPLAHAVNRVVITLAFGLIAGFLISQIVRAFTLGSEIGIRSFAAAVLPAVIITYFTITSASANRKFDRVPDVNLFLLSGLWLLILLAVSHLVNETFGDQIPLGEFATSLTLSALVLAAKMLPFQGLLSCAFGIISGFLVYLLIFGLPTV